MLNLARPITLTTNNTENTYIRINLYTAWQIRNYTLDGVAAEITNGQRERFRDKCQQTTKSDDPQRHFLE